MNIIKLITNYNKLIYKICFDMLSSKEDAEDATQDTYMKMFKNIERYNNLDEGELKNILCKIALNTCKDILKSKSYMINKPNTIAEIEMLDNYKQEYEILDNIINEEERLYITKNINRLPEKYRDILKYYYLDGIKLDELSLKLNIPKSTLKVQIYRAKNILKDNIIKDRGGGYFE